MAEQQQPDRVRTARRIGMSFVVALILWTLIAVTLGVLRGIAERAPAEHAAAAAAELAEEQPDEAATDRPETQSH